MRTGQNIYKRKDGRWEARVPLGIRANGRRYFKCFYGKTYQEARNRKQDYEKNIPFIKEMVTTSPDTFSSAAYGWLVVSEQDWKPATYIRYRNCLEKYILPHWGPLHVREIDQKVYDALITLLEKKLSVSSMQTVNTVISGSLKHTLKRLPVTCKKFVAERRMTPKDILSKAEIFRLRSYLEAEEDLTAIGIHLALYSGVRLGELCALTWADIDLETRTLYVRHTLQRIQNRNRLDGEPKTRLQMGLPKNKKERAIPLHEQILPVLERTRRLYLPSDYLLSGTSAPVEPRRMSSRFKRILKECGLRNIHFHVLRHTFATYSLESGMRTKVLSELMGHSSVKITMDRYVHLSNEFKEAQMNNLQYTDSTSISRQKNGQNDVGSC